MKFQDVFRFSFVIVSVVTLLFATSIVAQAASPRSGSGNFIQNFDKDGDGKVSKDEFTGPDKVFDAHDKNQDGYIDEGEAPTGRPPGAMKGGNFIQDFDKDGDGKVSKDEFTGSDKVFDLHDKNQDGYLDESEAPKGRKPRSMKGKKY